MTYSHNARKLTKSFLSIFERSVSVIVGLFSTFILNLLLDVEYQVDTLIIIIESYVIWQIINYSLISKLNTVVPEDEAKQWHAVVNRVSDFVTMLGLLLMTNFLLNTVESTFGMADFNLVEVIAVIYIIVLSLFTLAQTMFYLSDFPNDDKPK